MDYLEPLDYLRPGYADCYDELPLWSAPFGQLLLEHVPLRPGMTILDVGAGTGFLSIELAQRSGGAATVYAVDPWTEALARLRHKLDFLEIDNVRLIDGGAEHVELPAGSIDLVVSNLGIHNFEDPDAVLAECFRLAKPGATLALCTNLSGHMQELYAVYRTLLEERTPSEERAERLKAFDAHVEHRGTVDSVHQLLQRAGFEIAEVATSSFQMRFADGSALLRHAFIRLGFVPAWKELAPADAVEETFRALEARLNTLAAQRGSLDLTIPMAYLAAHKPGGAAG